MAPAAPGGSRAAFVELVLAALIVVALGHVVLFFLRWRYLPQPFVYDPSATFTDWFDTAYWAHHPGAYDVWQTVYPPLSFAFLRLFGISGCYDGDTDHARDCDWVGSGCILLSYALAVLVTALSYRRLPRPVAVSRTIAVGVGLPMLYALERGNLIVPCFVFFALGHARILRQSWLRWLAIGATINFKPYLLLAVLPYAARRKWRWLEGCGLATLLVYLASFALVGDGNPLQLIRNQLHWSDFVSNQYWWNVYYSTSFTSIVNAAVSPLPVLQFVGSRTVEGGLFWLNAIMLVGAGGVAASLLVAWNRPVAAPASRLAALGLSVVMTLSNPGGYMGVFLIFLILLERGDGVLLNIAIAAAYLLCIPFDYMFLRVFGNEHSSWLGGREVTATFGLTLGQFLRPALILLIQYVLVLATLTDAIRKRPGAAPLGSPETGALAPAAS
jgi:hypothetical protein